jgi:hypothetical protein
MMNYDRLEHACGKGMQKNMQLSNVTVPVKIEDRSNRKEKEFTLEEVNERIQNLVQPPLSRNLDYFKNICGLNAMGMNPHKL